MPPVASHDSASVGAGVDLIRQVKRQMGLIARPSSLPAYTHHLLPPPRPHCPLSLPDLRLSLHSLTYGAEPRLYLAPCLQGSQPDFSQSLSSKPLAPQAYVHTQGHSLAAYLSSFHLHTALISIRMAPPRQDQDCDAH